MAFTTLLALTLWGKGKKTKRPFILSSLFIELTRFKISLIDTSGDKMCSYTFIPTFSAAFRIELKYCFDARSLPLSMRARPTSTPFPLSSAASFFTFALISSDNFFPSMVFNITTLLQFFSKFQHLNEYQVYSICKKHISLYYNIIYRTKGTQYQLN